MQPTTRKAGQQQAKSKQQQAPQSAPPQQTSLVPPDNAAEQAAVTNAAIVRDQIAPGQDLDFVCQLFNLLETMHPSVQGKRLDLEKAVRDHFKGQRYVASRPDPGTTAARVLAMFNGHNARTVARTLGISRAHVYRILKQPGRQQ